MTKRTCDIWLGWDAREAAAYSVARESIRLFHRHTRINGVVLNDLRKQELYVRPTERRLGRLWDVISEANMSTEFAISRFLVPELARRAYKVHGWSLFMDCDVLVRKSLNPLFEQLDDAKALYCVKHDYKSLVDIKMDGQKQDKYRRKNWSSVMAFNVHHPANKALTVELINTVPGRDLHRFCWLKDEDIGELGPEWNYLVGEQMPPDDPTIVHFTLGTPDMIHGGDAMPYADQWWGTLERWAA